MLGITLKVDDTDKYLELEITPVMVQKNIEAVALQKFIRDSEFKHFFIFDESLIDAISSYTTAAADKSSEIINQRIGERRDSQIKCKIGDDQLSAYITITIGNAGVLPTLKSLKKELNAYGIKRGISNKRLTSMIQQCSQAQPNEIFEELVSKGLPPRAGKNSQLKPLVENALDRILKPQKVGTTKVDMRNLGAIICVDKGVELLRRMPPTNGRNGHTVTDCVVDAKAGEWLKLVPGDGTFISDADENLLLSDIAGMPKFKEQKMWVDDVFTCKGVNVGSGNVNYDGSVLVNGDVSERMEIYATGDVTVNGFVESATIRADGDIIITGGAMGKANDNGTEYSTKLNAKGNVHLQHGLGIDINANGDVNVSKQLAYSRINCNGKVTAGAVDNPNGNIYACTIKCQDKVTAGTLGAVSGSKLNIDFSDGFNILLERKDSLDELVKQIKQNNTRHLKRINMLNSQFIPEDMQARVDNANQLLKNESQLLQLLENKAEEMQKSKEKYQADIQLICNKRVYPGVVIKFNNRTWRANKEYDRTKVFFNEHQWHSEPL